MITVEAMVVEGLKRKDKTQKTTRMMRRATTTPALLSPGDNMYVGSSVSHQNQSSSLLNRINSASASAKTDEVTVFFLGYLGKNLSDMENVLLWLAALDCVAIFVLVA